MISTDATRSRTEMAIMNLYRSGIMEFKVTLLCMPSNNTPPVRMPKKEPHNEVMQEKTAI